MGKYKKKPVASISWFRSEKGRHGGRLDVIQYHAVREDGTIKTIDVIRGTIRVNTTFGSRPVGKLTKITENQFDYQLEKMLELKRLG